MAAVVEHRRNFKERQDCLQMYSNSELIERFRLDYDGIAFVDSLVRDRVFNVTNRNHGLSSVHKLLKTLRYSATGKMQLYNGDEMGVIKPTVSRAISVTLDSLTSPALVSRFIRFPTNATAIRKN